jgi:type VI secretion system protein ImpK
VTQNAHSQRRASSANTERSSLTERYREFWGELIGIKRRLEASAAPPEAEPVGGMPQLALRNDPPPARDDYDVFAEADRTTKTVLADYAAPSVFDADGTMAVGEVAREIRQALIHRIAQLREVDADRWEDYEKRRWSQVEYVMAATADEVLLHQTRWNGQKAWSAHLLEEELFRSHEAGERFFVVIDQLLLRRDPASVEIAMVHLLALSLGFQGKYRLGDPEGRLPGYRRRLYFLVFGTDPDLDDVSRRLFPQSMAYTVDTPRDLRLPSFRPWLIALGALVFIYVVIAHSIWIEGTAGWSAVLDNLDSAAHGEKAR